MSASIVLSASVAKVISFAMHQANVPVIGELRLRNDSEENIDGITVELTSEPSVIAKRSWTFDRIRAKTEVTPANRTGYRDLNGTVLVQRQLEKANWSVTEWAGWFCRLIFRWCLAWASFWSRSAKMAFSLPRSLF